MLNYSLMKPEGLLLLQPQGPLTQQDFERMNLDVNAYLAEHAKLHGVMIQAKDFPGWENWAGLSAHLGFVRDHHKQVERIALVTDSQLAGVAEFFGKHFTGAQVRHFPFTDDELALQWLQTV
ncbi:STAS/SEC14 domain-containing protein [Comamonas aquatilis]|uniref:STAS/SEC14 domain-containing protein n=1 Tax=Comamonas aquatilis TaxID=1778406 RepID=UPI0039EDF5D1